LGKLVIFTGAGISAESGISTFRDANGLWENHEIDKVCNHLTWKNNFDLVHDFYNARRMAVGAAKPNAAHEAVRRWQQRYETVLLTQNIDDLFEKAGCTDVIHLHGKATEMMCEACGNRWDIGHRAWDASQTADGDRCPKCDSRRGVKPGVVFFHEAAPLYRVLDFTLRSLRPTDAVVVIGTSAQVVNIGAMLERRPGFKVLNNLQPAWSSYDRDIEGAIYDERLFKPATMAVAEIDILLQDWFDND
jgi:NAD-dependent deacetylase